MKLVSKLQRMGSQLFLLLLGTLGMGEKLTRDNYESFSSVQFRSVAQSSPTLCNPMDTRPPCPSATPGGYSNQCPLSQWCHPTISSSVIPFSSRLQSFPASGSFQMSWFLAWGGQRIGASASVLPMNTRTDLFENGLVGSPCSPRYSQESSPTPQFKSISSSVLTFLYSPTLTSIHECWKNHSFN